MKILIKGADILAVNVVDGGSVWAAPDQSIPKTVAAGAQLVDTVLPAGYVPGRFTWNGTAVVALPPVPEPVSELILRQYDGVVQGRLDDVARSFGYGDPNRPDVSPMLHAISYAEEPAVAKFQAEGRLLRAWRSRYWAATWPILQAVQGGQRAVPLPSALLAELDADSPPPTAEDVTAEMQTLG